MAKLKLVVSGNPISKSNAMKTRWSRASRRSEVYYDPKFLEYEERIKNEGIEYMKENSLSCFNEGPVHMHIVYYLGTLHRKDLPNLPKTTCDALSDVFYRDDAQIVTMVLEKRYDKENPRVEIEVSRPEGDWETKQSEGYWSMPNAYRSDNKKEAGGAKPNRKSNSKTTAGGVKPKRAKRVPRANNKRG